MAGKLVYSKPGLGKIGSKSHLACITGSSAAAEGWACENGPKPGAGPGQCNNHGSGAVYDYSNVCFKNGDKAVGNLSVCITFGINAVTTTAGNACITGNGANKP